MQKALKVFKSLSFSVLNKKSQNSLVKVSVNSTKNHVCKSSKSVSGGGWMRIIADWCEALEATDALLTCVGIGTVVGTGLWRWYWALALPREFAAGGALLIPLLLDKTDCS